MHEQRGWNSVRPLRAKLEGEMSTVAMVYEPSTWFENRKLMALLPTDYDGKLSTIGSVAASAGLSPRDVKRIKVEEVTNTLLEVIFDEVAS